MRNQIVEKATSFKGFTDETLARIIQEVSAETGFEAEGEVARRTIYDPDKAWRVRIAGEYKKRAAMLRLDGLKLEVDEEMIRDKFREQAKGSKVRPPLTYASKPFDDAKGYAWSIEEFVVGDVLFQLAIKPAGPVRAFSVFYRALREAVKAPFWDESEKDARAFTEKQLDKWLELARERNPEYVTRHEALLNRLRERQLAAMDGQELRFQHPHLSGADVRLQGGEYVVFANHFWSWRQPGYDAAFPIWGQWLAREEGERTPEAIADITDTWLKIMGERLSDLAAPEHVRAMLCNRIFGSLILDVPAQLATQTPESVAALEKALAAEGERLLK